MGSGQQGDPSGGLLSLRPAPRPPHTNECYSRRLGGPGGGGSGRPWEPGETPNLLTPIQACSGTSFSGEGCSDFLIFSVVSKPHKKLINHTPSSLQEIPGATQDPNLRKRTKVVGVPRP